ncbi:threonine-phosphate decarboxylase CobD [Roseivivax sp. CAU 1761]
MRDHGGNLDAAMAAHGGARADWLDLSTGINPEPYPLPPLPPEAWTALPTRSEMAALAEAARLAYATPLAAVPMAGAQAAIQLLPRIAPDGPVRILAPTYNEHAASFRAAGRAVEEVARPEALAGAGVAVIVNPNNPDGRRSTPLALSALAREVGLLVVDESFADPEPDLSLAPAPPPNALILRSFGKFYGLAGLRLGFALAAPDLARRLAEAAGPWPVCGAAIVAGRAALGDAAWQAATRARLARDAARLDALAGAAGWAPVGGTPLFRSYAVPGGAAAAQAALARARIWTRAFPYRAEWLRLGLPPGHGWDRLARAVAGLRA